MQGAVPRLSNQKDVKEVERQLSLASGDEDTGSSAAIEQLERREGSGKVIVTVEWWAEK